jgi:hypothetical protein
LHSILHFDVLNAGTSFYKDGVSDGMPHMTLMFTTGPGYNFSYDGTKVKR